MLLVIYPYAVFISLSKIFKSIHVIIYYQSVILEYLVSTSFAILILEFENTSTW